MLKLVDFKPKYKIGIQVIVVRVIYSNIVGIMWMGLGEKFQNNLVGRGGCFF